MHSADMSAEEIPPSTVRSRVREEWSPAKPLPPSQLEQVAAVCYRVRGAEVEFLLVRTRKGRWTFPKGGVESGLTHSQAAALEAFEEAGVHGRIEEVACTRYRRGKRINMQEFGAGTVHAYLCEVLRLGTAQEANRSRTWFSAQKAKWQLRENRTPENGAEMARVVDCAVARIQGREGFRRVSER
jgi:8-oxo-dGTP pyrophosphatase MutT (NUDIX family)